MISERTKAALQVAKARGKRLGNPRIADAAAMGRAALKAAGDAYAANVLPVIREIQATGATSANAIASKLNERKVQTRRGGRWSHVQVGAFLEGLISRVRASKAWVSLPLGVRGGPVPSTSAFPCQEPRRGPSC